MTRNISKTGVSGGIWRLSFTPSFTGRRMKMQVKEERRVPWNLNEKSRLKTPRPEAREITGNFNPVWVT